ncbi:hypothetical protein Bbelb_213330 [Branchiostoma belcheri]|nr:hypothetical protein Bbelb_213330 [Branchiostoma belcheri]
MATLEISLRSLCALTNFRSQRERDDLCGGETGGNVTFRTATSVRCKSQQGFPLTRQAQPHRKRFRRISDRLSTSSRLAAVLGTSRRKLRLGRTHNGTERQRSISQTPTSAGGVTGWSLRLALTGQAADTASGMDIDAVQLAGRRKRYHFHIRPINDLVPVTFARFFLRVTARGWISRPLTPYVCTLDSTFPSGSSSCCFLSLFPGNVSLLEVLLKGSSPGVLQLQTLAIQPHISVQARHNSGLGCPMTVTSLLHLLGFSWDSPAARNPPPSRRAEQSHNRKQDGCDERAQAEMNAWRRPEKSRLPCRYLAPMDHLRHVLQMNDIKGTQLDASEPLDLLLSEPYTRRENDGDILLKQIFLV